jgi:hypothetical protein
MEDPIFIKMSISHYGAMLKLDLDEQDRAVLTRLLAEAEQKLKAAPARSDAGI